MGISSTEFSSLCPSTCLTRLKLEETIAVEDVVP